MSAPAELPRTGRDARPRRVVALGGGTGLPAVLRGLRGVVDGTDATALTAVVTMSDDGGSSGRLRESLGMPPPGDVRNCLVALAEEEDLLAGLFQHRYGGGAELDGHSVGNLILAALAEQTGSFLHAIEMSSHVLRTVGRILPATQDDVRLAATLDDGSEILGETSIAACERRIRRISLRPKATAATPGVIDAILEAELVVLGPGSLYTSLAPNIVVQGVGDALRSTPAVVVQVANLVSERGEASGLTLPDHVRVVEEHAGGPFVDAVLVNDGPIDRAMLLRYEKEGATPLRWERSPAGRPLVVERNLLAAGAKLRHEPLATANGLVAAWSAVTERAAERKI